VIRGVYRLEDYNNLKEVQKNKSEIKININEVGIKNIKIPLIFKDKKYKNQKTIGDVSIFVNLPYKYKGTHMSRFIEILTKYTQKVLSVKLMDKLILEIMNTLGAKIGRLEIKFPYFILKKTPISKKESLLDYKCKFIRISKKGKKKVDHIMEVTAPIMTTCPCSKEISKHNPHDQRGYATVKIKFNKFIWIEEVVKIIEEAASCDIYPLLKRTDEKFVVEKAYDNPKFVEDVVRGIANKLQKDKRIGWFKVECENQESIHNHNVYACIEK
jgi:GTP cyclohydrolase I